MDRTIRRTTWAAAVAVVALAGFAIAGCGANGKAAAGADSDSPPTEATAVTTGADGSQARIWVTEDGFVPANVTVPAGRPVTLLVTRQTEHTCATKLVMKAEGIERELPLGQQVAISFTPDQAGRFDYACAMGMLKGTVTVQ